MSTKKLTVSQALVRFMDNQYVRQDGHEYKFIESVFGVFGHGCVTGMGQALEERGHNLKFYQGKNEQGMAHAAIAYAKQLNRRKIIPCTSSIGPGALNMVTAAATATVSGIPLLLLPGDVFSSRQPDPVLQQIEYTDTQTVTANEAFKPVCRYWDRIERPEQIMMSAINAFGILTDPSNCGAVCISLPQDTECEAYEYPEYFFNKRVWEISARPPESQAVKKVVQAVINSSRPFIICGGGVKYSEAGDVLSEFASKFNIPFGETQSGKGIISWKHPMNMGGIGVTGTSSANILAQKADLVIGIGTRFTDFTTCSKWLFKNPEVKFISINPKRKDAHKLDSIPVEADAKSALKAISAELSNLMYMSDYKKESDKLKREWKKESDRLYEAKTVDKRLSQTRVLGLLNSFMNKEDVILTAGGSLPGDLQRLWRSYGLNTYHVEYGFSCMGYEVCGALGCKMALGDEHEVYSVVGDGSYLLLHSELLTAIQEGIKINILVFDNRGWGCIENLQNNAGSITFGTEFAKRDFSTDRLDGKPLEVDFVKNAQSYGAKGYSVTTDKEFIEALKDAKKQKLPCVFHIKVAPGSMTKGYDSWWRVGIAQISESEEINIKYNEMKNNIEEAREY